MVRVGKSGARHGALFDIGREFPRVLEHIGKRMPKKGRGKAKTLDPLSIPVEFQTTLEARKGETHAIAWPFLTALL